MPFSRSPDMIAFTIGRLVIDRLKSGGDLSLDEIEMDLSRIAMGEQPSRITPEMANGALNALRKHSQIEA